jgi:hypothetical protein
MSRVRPKRVLFVAAVGVMLIHPRVLSLPPGASSRNKKNLSSERFWRGVVDTICKWAISQESSPNG